MADHNGSTMGLAIIVGELRADSRHQTAAIGHMTQAIERQTEILIELPSRLSMLTASEKPPSSATVGILKAIPPILKAMVPILTIIGLMSGNIAWTDIPKLLGAP